MIQKDAGISDRMLCEEARISFRTLTALRRNRRDEDLALYALGEAVEQMRSSAQSVSAMAYGERAVEVPHPEIYRQQAINPVGMHAVGNRRQRLG
jgi:hypothetical protein